ncbi:transcript variant X2 [Nothobranchius furzeri]|uniref:Transcript variant X2 n=2 Tax=Nothobranchius TaxID=28779 RepID=A0A9D2YEH2_NOTFU|nr:transcript variant X2 [Nothobranchius furzeri]
MRGRCNLKDPPGSGLCALLQEERSAETDQESVRDGGGRQNKRSRCSVYGGEKVYVGVRVRKPVKDLLKTIRLSQGQDKPDLKAEWIFFPTGNLQRARTRSRNKVIKVSIHPSCSYGKLLEYLDVNVVLVQCSMKSQEELAILIEVLEEDLRNNSFPFSSQNPPTASFLENPESSASGHGDEYDEIIPSPDSYMSYSLGIAEHHLPSDRSFASFQPSSDESGDMWFEPQDKQWDQNSCDFFWTQLQKEESQLRATSDAELLATDGHGRTLLHEVVCIGKRALAYAIAKRMVALNSLDLKDTEGMVKLKSENIVQKLIPFIPKQIHEKDLLHAQPSIFSSSIISLDVLKQALMDGVYVDVDATDNSGMSVLQCAAAALKASVSAGESFSQDHSRLRTLRQQHMVETLECLLQIDSYLHTTAALSVTGEPEYAAQSWLHSQHARPAGLFETPTVMF